MTGADVKRQLMEALTPDDVDGWSGEKLLAASPALAPCVLLTAEEAKVIERPLLDALSDDHLRGDVDAALALLTPDQEGVIA